MQESGFFNSAEYFLKSLLSIIRFQLWIISIQVL
jgi:hypothetical protein